MSAPFSLNKKKNDLENVYTPNQYKDKILNISINGMNILDELYIETGDYFYRRDTNALRKWKFGMFQVILEFKEYKLKRKYTEAGGLNLNGNCYKTRYITKMESVLFNHYGGRQSEMKSAMSPDKEYLKKCLFGSNDGAFFAKKSLEPVLGHKMPGEERLEIHRNFLQLLNSIIISLRVLCSPERTDGFGDLHKAYDYIRPDEFRDKCREWYYFGGKFWKKNHYHNYSRTYQANPENNPEPTEGLELVIKPSHNIRFSEYGNFQAETIVVSALGTKKREVVEWKGWRNKETPTNREREEVLNHLHQTNNIWTLMMNSVFDWNTLWRSKSATFCVPYKYVHKKMDYSVSHKSHYDLTNRKPWNEKGQAHQRGMKAISLYSYVSYNYSGEQKNPRSHKCGWKFGGITAEQMVEFCKANGYAGKKMSYQECIRWILKDMDSQDFTNREQPKAKKGVKVIKIVVKATKK